MSMPRRIKIKCPNCNYECNFTIWHTINVDVNPEIRVKVKNGKIFDYKCKHCKNKYNVEYKFMYHDCSNGFMIWYFPKGQYDINKENEEINNMDSEFNIFKEKMRIVDDKRELIEKINIFEDRLNDFIIEIIKYLILDQINDNTVEIFYSGIKDDMINFCLSNGKNASFPYNSYNMMLEEYIIDEPKKCFILNRNTVFNYIKNK